MDNGAKKELRSLLRRARKDGPSFQAKWPQRNIVKLTVVTRVNNPQAREAVRLGGTFRVFRREKAKGGRSA